MTLAGRVHRLAQGLASPDDFLHTAVKRAPGRSSCGVVSWQLFTPYSRRIYGNSQDQTSVGTEALQTQAEKPPTTYQLHGARWEA